MNEAAYKKLSLLIQKYCPDFVIDKYPKFIAFLKAYYDWSYNKEEFNPWRVTSHLIEWGDIDETIDKFIDYFKEEYLNDLNIDISGDERTLIKHTKEFYSSRGTPESFRFLLRLLSGNTGTIFYPGKYLMRSSDGVWRTDHAIFVEFDSRLTNDYISTKIRGKDSGSTATVEGIETHFGYNTQTPFYKVYISNIIGSFDDSIIVFNNGSGDVEIPIYTTASGISILNKGNNYSVGDNILIQDNPTFTARIAAILPGRLDSYAILNGGSGYSVGDVVKVSCNRFADYSAMPTVFVDEVDASGAITSLDIRYSGYGLLEVPEFVEVESVSGSGAEIEFISNDAGSIARISLISAEIGYSNGTPLVIDSDTGVNGEVSLDLGPVYTTIPYYYEPGSFLSDEFKLQDSDYWQDYSYEIKSTLTLDSEMITQFSEFKEVFKRLVHPAGFKLFNSFVLSNHIDLKMLYVNSTIDIHPAPSFIDLVNWIEMVSHWNRIIDNDIIFQHRFTTIAEDENTTIGTYRRTGGQFVHSTITISEE